MIVWKDNSVTVFRSSLYMTNSIVVQTDDLVLVVDPTWLPHEIASIRAYTDSIRGGRPLYLLFTHSDYDHILGWGAFRDAATIASAPFAAKRPEAKEAIVETVRAFDDEYYIERGYDVAYPDVDIVIGEEGESFVVGGTRLVFYGAQGHNDDGLLTAVEPLGLLVAGDYLSDVEFPYIYVSSAQYEETVGKLDRLLDDHRIRLLLPGHGSPTDDRSEMKRRQTDSLAYIASMRERIRSGDRDGIDRLIDGCSFPRNMRKFHDNNRRLMEQECRANQASAAGRDPEPNSGERGEL